MRSVALAVALLAGATGSVAPAELLASAPAPAGFELASEPASDLTFAEYAPLSPDAIAHVEPDGRAAQSMRAAVDVWTSDDVDILLRELTEWGSTTDADAFVEQAVVVGTQAEFDRVEPPFDGGVAFFGADDGIWTRTVTWRQGSYGVTVAHFGVSEGDFRIIDTAATDLADHLTESTGHPVDASVVDDPRPAGDDDDSAGGIGLGTIVLWIVVVGGVMWLIARLRRRSAAFDRGRADRSPAAPDESAEVDDLIERARARGRARREIDATPDSNEPAND